MWMLNCRWRGLRGISTWNCWATWVSSRGPPQSGQTRGNGSIAYRHDQRGDIVIAAHPVGLGNQLATGCLRLRQVVKDRQQLFVAQHVVQSIAAQQQPVAGLHGEKS